MSKGLIKGLIFLTGFVVVIAIAILITTKIDNVTDNNSCVDSNNTQVVDEGATSGLPEIVCDNEITVDLLDTASLNYQILNQENYNVSVSILDTSIATIDLNNVIHPLSVGTTTILLELDSLPQITKSISLTIKDCVKSVGFAITDTENINVNNYYTNTYYFLHITQNIATLTEPTFISSMQDFTLQAKNDNVYIFKFKVLNAGTFSFEYHGQYINKTESYMALTLPSVIDLNFTNISLNNNNFNLYLFDNDYLAEANLNNIFANCEFNINKVNDADEISYQINGNSIEIISNTIYARLSGTANIFFTQYITSTRLITRTITVKVNEITLNSLMINNNTKNLLSEDTISLQQNENYDFTFLKLPVYALYDLVLDYNDNLVKYENNKLSLKSENSASVYLKYNNNVVYTLNLNFYPASQSIIIYKIELDEFYNCEILLNDTNKTIIIEAVEPNNSFFNIRLSGAINEAPVNLLNITAQFSDTSVCKFPSYPVIYDSTLQVVVVGTGNCTITIYDNENDNQFDITVTVA